MPSSWRSDRRERKGPIKIPEKTEYPGAAPIPIRLLKLHIECRRSGKELPNRKRKGLNRRFVFSWWRSTCSRRSTIKRTDLEDRSLFVQ